MSKFTINWLDRGREPQCPPNPEYPHGIDVGIDLGNASCRTDLPYPAKRCGYYYVECSICGSNAIITTAGRPDDPRSVFIPCQTKGHA